MLSSECRKSRKAPAAAWSPPAAGVTPHCQEPWPALVPLPRSGRGIRTRSSPRASLKVGYIQLPVQVRATSPSGKAVPLVFGSVCSFHEAHSSRASTFSALLSTPSAAPSRMSVPPLDHRTGEVVKVPHSAAKPLASPRSIALPDGLTSASFCRFCSNSSAVHASSAVAGASTPAASRSCWLPHSPSPTSNMPTA
jgi:hypothetical protein